MMFFLFGIILSAFSIFWLSRVWRMTNVVAGMYDAFVAFLGGLGLLFIVIGILLMAIDRTIEVLS